MTSPLLKRFGDLTPADFESHPVWVSCHSADSEEPWYDETDEETFRPRQDALPADPSEGMLLVRATVTLEEPRCWWCCSPPEPRASSHRPRGPTPFPGTAA
jgi:hypothetical protein